jgi:hypothetical protein
MQRDVVAHPLISDYLPGIMSDRLLEDGGERTRLPILDRLLLTVIITASKKKKTNNNYVLRL